MTTYDSPAPLILALVGAVALAASACGSSSSGGASSQHTTVHGGGRGRRRRPPAAAPPIDVTLKDFAVDVASTGSLAPGTYTFHVTNNGPPHTT